MKKIALIGCLFFSCFCLYSQSNVGILISVDTAFAVSGSGADASYATNLNFISENMIAANNQNEQFLFSRTRNNIFNISKVSTAGNLTVFKNIELPMPAPIESYAINGFVCSSSGDITCMITRSQFTGASVNFKIFLIKFNSSGALLWEKMIEVPAVTYVYYNHCFNQTPSGEYYISISDYSFMGVIKLDSNGNLLWSKSITGTTSGGTKSPGFSSAVTPSGGCISTIKDYDYEMIVNLNADGTLNWSNSYLTGDYRWTKSIQTDSLGNSYVVGSIRNYSSGSNITFCHKFDQNGNLIYAKKINPSENTYYKHIKPLSTGEAIILTEYPNFEITKINTLGNVVWTKGAVGIKSIYNDINGKDATGYFSNSYNSTLIFKGNYIDSMLAVFKVDENLSNLCNVINYASKTALDDLSFMNAEVDNSCNIYPLNINFVTPSISYTTKNYLLEHDYCLLASEPEINNQVTVVCNFYPNPANDVLHFDVDLTEQSAQKLTLKMYDVQGRLLVNKRFDNTPLDLSEFTSGLYLISIENSQNTFIKKKLIISK